MERSLPLASPRVQHPQITPGCLPEHVRQSRVEWPVALVSMPFSCHLRPSIQLGLLKSIASAHGFPTTTFHLNLDFAKQIGPYAYEVICGDGSLSIGDWLFSVAAFDGEAPDAQSGFLDHHGPAIEKALRNSNTPREYLLALRDDEIPRYLDRLMETIRWDRFKAVGFTSTFQQNTASFALAKRIKAEFPSVQLLFGGANFAGEMGSELVRTIPCIDYAVIGEGEQSFPDLLIALHEGRDSSKVPGIACRIGGAVKTLEAQPMPTAMDDLPLPDYDEYFERAEALGLLTRGPRRSVMIPFESARGCWWGQKHHCTFCGLNADEMAFRAKSPARLRHELNTQAKRYRSFHFEAVDNIMDMCYLKNFLPDLVREEADFKLFYEVKANLTREQIRLLYTSGVRHIQPGIESLSSHVLQLMRKGIKAAQNVNLLRWTLYYGIRVSWNLLYGFPRETAEDYAHQAKLIPHLLHLQPPDGIGRVLMERFSPLFFDRASFPARNVRPHSSYQYIYPKCVDIERVAYMFDYEFEEMLPSSAYDQMQKEARVWRDAWKQEQKPSLTFWSSKGFLQIEDCRDLISPSTYTFTDPLASMYTSLSNRAKSAKQVKESMKLPWSLNEIEAALNEFCERGLMMRDNQRFLSLALPATRGR
jgi:ribosomal peptide maturation radical SAM protein 1